MLGDVLLRDVDIKMGGVAVGARATASQGGNEQCSRIDLTLMIDMGHGVEGTRRAIAKVPKQCVILKVDLGLESDRLLNTVLVISVRLNG